MAVGSFASGSQAAVINTEHFLADVNEAGVFVLVVDTNALAAGDVIELRAYQMALTGGNVRQVFVHRFYGNQSQDPIKSSRPVSNELVDSQSVRFSLKQTFGTGRTFPWKVLKHA